MMSTERATEREQNPTWEPTPENVKRWAEVRRRNGDTEAFVRLTVIADRLRSPSDRGRDGHLLAAIETLVSALTILDHDEGGESMAITNVNNALYHLRRLHDRAASTDAPSEGERLMWLVGDGQLFYYDDEEHAHEYAANEPGTSNAVELVGVRRLSLADRPTQEDGEDGD